MFELADTKEQGARGSLQSWQLQVLNVQTVWSVGHKQTLSCMLFVPLVALDVSVVQSGWISEALKVTPSVLYPVWILEHLPQTNLLFAWCCFSFPNCKPWVGGSSNKIPEVLTAELIRWHDDSIQFRPHCRLFPYAFGGFPGREILLAVKCAKWSLVEMSLGFQYIFYVFGTKTS